ncbi:MipA/OmpV family protein [Rhizobium sp. FKL33]|uniref:MipA/OmpV family protein n=1 Tax=Rhizobium sp. FKL33 TaxID=2562307 RepID=UPI0010C08B4D|nr:MipA/OmpV family protein [Rhizobium sp. FKL33]
MSRRALVLAAALVTLPLSALAEDGQYFWSGDWYLKAGASGFVAPRFEGSKSYILQASPIISLSRQSATAPRFTSRDDNPSFALFENDMIRAGITGKLVMPRDRDTSDDLKALKAVKFGLEAGVFGEVYPTDWMRFRTEIRHGIRSHNGVVADLALDGFVDVTDTVRVSAGPRLSIASEDYMDAYYKVTKKRSAKHGLSAYDPEGGFKSVGFGSEVVWKATDRIEAGVFGQYNRLVGPAADSSLVEERGSKDQFVVGISTSYKFGFTLP